MSATAPLALTSCRVSPCGPYAYQNVCAVGVAPAGVGAVVAVVANWCSLIRPPGPHVYAAIGVVALQRTRATLMSFT